MKTNKQIQLIEQCIEWFDDEYPELDGCLSIVPIVQKSIKPRRIIGFITYKPIFRLMLTYRRRVWFFHTPNELSHHPVFGAQMLNRPEHEHVTTVINDLNEFADWITRIMVHYQIDFKR